MKWFENFFRKKPNKSTYAPTLTGYTPIFNQYGQDIYSNDVVQQALKCIVDEIKKLVPAHVVKADNGDYSQKRSSIQDVLDDPNNLMTTSDFLDKVMWMLLLNYNAFIIPTYSVWRDKKTGATTRKYESLYPINPSEVTFIEDEANQIFVEFRFLDGFTTTIPYDDVIHIRYNYSLNDYMGGDIMGRPNYGDLIDTVNINNDVIRNIAKAMKASYSINGIVKYNSIMDKGKTESAIKELEQKLANSESGLLPIDLKAEFVPMDRKAELVDDATLKFLDEKILRTWGISQAILNGDYTKEQYESFYQKCLEVIILSMEQAFTKKLFSDRERSYGNMIKFYPKELIFLTMEQKIELVNLLAPTGGLFENEKRAIFGLPPISELDGKRYMSLNWIDANNANEYQLGDDKQNE